MSTARSNTHTNVQILNIKREVKSALQAFYAFSFLSLNKTHTLYTITTGNPLPQGFGLVLQFLEPFLCLPKQPPDLV